MNVNINVKFVKIDRIAKYQIHFIYFVWAFSAIFMIVMKINSSTKNMLLLYSVFFHNLLKIYLP